MDLELGGDGLGEGGKGLVVHNQANKLLYI